MSLSKVFIASTAVLFSFCCLLLLSSYHAKSEKQQFINGAKKVQRKVDDMAVFIEQTKQRMHDINHSKSSELFSFTLKGNECLITSKNKTVKDSLFLGKAYPELCREANISHDKSLYYALALSNIYESNVDMLREFSSLFLMSTDGFIISSNKSDIINSKTVDFESELFTRPYITKHHKNGFISRDSYVITEPYDDLFTSQSMITLSTTIFDDDKFIGYLNLDVRVDDLIGAESQLFLTNKLSNVDLLGQEIFYFDRRSGLYIATKFSTNELLKRGIDHFKWMFIVTIFIVVITVTILLIGIERKKSLRYKYESEIDHLTQLPNRLGFDSHLGEISTMMSRLSSIAIIDIDNFKSINDNYGHLCGDYVLKSVATLIKSSIRSNDICSRFGGEEFIIMSMTDDTATGQNVLERVRKHIEQQTFTYGAIKLSVTVSIGSVWWLNDRRRHSHQLLQELNQADKLLYKAKQLGKNQTIYSEFQPKSQD